MSQALIPLGLKAVGEALQAEVPGPPLPHGDGQAGVVRWGQTGRVDLSDRPEGNGHRATRARPGGGVRVTLVACDTNQLGRQEEGP